MKESKQNKHQKKTPHTLKKNKTIPNKNRTKNLNQKDQIETTPEDAQSPMQKHFKCFAFYTQLLN